MMYAVNASELLFGILVLVGFGLLIFVAVRFGGSRGAGATDRQRGRSRAREVLDERYARGELTTQEYRERLQAIGEGG